MMQATRQDAMQLVMEASKLFVQMSHNGIRIDTDYLTKAENSINQELKEIENDLSQDKIWNLWKKRFGSVVLSKDKQLGKILFDELGYKSQGLTESGQYKTDKLSFDNINIPFTKRYIRWKELIKARDTFLKGIREETVNNYLHAFFHMHTTTSYRTSSSDINLQNLPVRNSDVGQLIRTCFIPRPGHVFIEIDFGSLEVRISACHNRDPVLIDYIKDPTTDMHRDQARELFFLDDPDEDFGTNKDLKNLRFYAKNQFVFAEFYGSYFKQCAPLLWQSMEKFSLKTGDGTPIKKHLRNNGIKKLGGCVHGEPVDRATFEEHVQQVEEKLWETFKVYKKWRYDFYDAYLKQGYFDFPTGFRASGYYRRNEVYSLSIQGSASHCLLWSVIQMQKWLRKYKMKSKIVNQVHDSCLGDVHESEVEDYVNKMVKLMTGDLPRNWKWIIVPLEVEVEMCEKNWYGKDKFNLEKWRERAA